MELTAAQKQMLILGGVIVGAVGVAYMVARSNSGDPIVAGATAPELGGSVGGSGVAGITPAITYNMGAFEDTPSPAFNIPPIPPLQIQAPDNSGLNSLLSQLSGAKQSSGSCCGAGSGSPYNSMISLLPPVPTSNVDMEYPPAYPTAPSTIMIPPVSAGYSMGEWGDRQNYLAPSILRNIARDNFNWNLIGDMSEAIWG